VNYWVCVACGLWRTPDYFAQVAASGGEWLPLALLQGTLFITFFSLIGWAAQRIGVAYTAVVTRVSVVIPTVISILYFGEDGSVQRWVGLVAALVAVLLLHVKYFRKNKGKTEGKSKGMPAPIAGQPTLTIVVLIGVVLFLGSGTTDTLFKVFDVYHAPTVAGNVFTITLFGVAGILGTLVSILQALRGRVRLHPRNLISGLVLGVPNYASIIFLLLALERMDAVVFYPINNVGILVLSTLVGVFYYKEPFRGPSWAGLVLAVASIVLMSWE